MEEGEPLSSLTWARRRLCPFLGATCPSCSFVFVGGWGSSSFVAVVVGGRGRQWRVVSWSMGSWSSVVLAVRGWVVVVRGHWIFMSGGSWSSMWGSSAATQCGWIAVVYGRVVCVVCRLGGRGCPWGGSCSGRPSGGRVHLCASGDGHLWAVVVVRVCEVVVTVICGRSWSGVGGS